MSYLLLYGKARPAFDFLFLNGSLSQAAAFARASTKNTFDKTGNLVNVANGMPAFFCDPRFGKVLGLSYEPQRTNYHQRSWRLGAWINNYASSTTDNALVSPDGTQNASSIVAAAKYTGRFLGAGGLSPNTYYAISGFVKITAGPMVQVRCGIESVEGGTGNGYVLVIPSTGTISGFPKAYGASCTLLPNGWAYFRYYILTGLAQTSLTFVAYANDAAGSFSLWGAQIEALGAVPGNGLATSTIYTDGSAVTRAADQLSFTIPNGVSLLRCVFDDGSTQNIAVTPGGVTLPTSLDRLCLRQIISV